MRVGIDAHKMKCTTVMFDGDSVTGSFDFQTTRHEVYEFMEKVPEGSIAEQKFLQHVMILQGYQDPYNPDLDAYIYQDIQKSNS